MNSTEEKDIPQNEGDDSSLDELKAQAQEYLDGWKRSKAELINFKKEESERVSSAQKFGQKALILDLLTVLDSFELALPSISDEGALKGVEMIRSQMREVLRRYGVELLAVKVGDAFDASIHESLEEVEGGEASTIAEVVSLGYALHGHTLRPARVKVFR